MRKTLFQPTDECLEKPWRFRSIFQINRWPASRAPTDYVLEMVAVVAYFGLSDRLCLVIAKFTNLAGAGVLGMAPRLYYSRSLALGVTR